MNTIKSQIPNLLTLSNLLCGCLAIKYAFEWDLVMAAYLVGLTCIFDFLDGFVARLLKVSGEMGKQLDSLADMVSFGVVPGVVMFQMMRIISFEKDYGTDEHTWGLNHFTIFENLDDYVSPFCYLAFLIPILSAYRLAKFNLDLRQTDKFIGLPTPANAIFICSLGILFVHQLGFDIKQVPNWKIFYQWGQSSFGGQRASTLTLYHFVDIFTHEKETVNKITQFGPFGANFSRSFVFAISLSITLIFSFLLIAELPLFALKFKNFTWADNKIRYIFLIISLAMLIIFQFIAIPFIVILYILLSILNNLIFKQ